jgi:tight adherence protein C
VLLAGAPAAWPMERVLAAKLVLGGTGVLFGLFRFLGAPSAGGLFLLAALAGGGYLLPDLLLHNTAGKRQKAIGLALPDTLDQITIAVEAGLGFDAAMARAGATGKGPLAEELVRTLQDVQAGMSRSQALKRLADRTNVAELRHFVLALLQADSYGVPVAQVLRVQAAELRVKRRQRAEEKAMKIPVKVIFPLILFILPAMFVVIIGPAAIRIGRSFVGGG